MPPYDFKSLFAEFLRADAAASPRARAERWSDVRDEARTRWARVLALRAKNQPYTEAVLDGLLPYADTPANRAAGRWVHPSSTLATDVRAWFEREGWVQPAEWPMAAHAVVQFIERCMLCPDRLQEVCDRFTRHGEVRGFQSALLSPMLNALVPDRFLIVSARSLSMLRAFTGVPWSPRVETFPRANEALAAFLAAQRVVITRDETRGMRPGDVLDDFARWFVSKTADTHDEAWDRLQASTQDTKELTVWKVAPGDQSPRWFKCLADQSIAFAWAELGDLSSLSREEFARRLQGLAIEHDTFRLGGVEHLWRITRSERAVFVAARDGSAILGVGRVTGRYEYRAGERFPHRIPVDWFDTAERAVSVPDWARPVVGIDLARAESLLGRSLRDLYPEKEEISGEVPAGETAAGASDALADALPEVFHIAPRLETTDFAQRASAAALPGPMMARASSRPSQMLPAQRTTPHPAMPRSVSDPALRSVSDPAPARLTTVPSPRLADASPRKGSLRPTTTLSADTSYPEDELRRWLDAIARKGQALVAGPTGSGKTWLARRLAAHLAGADGRAEVLQLHASYRYEDFVERVDGSVCVPGRFAEFVERATGAAGTYVLLLDDLQRADLPRVLGESLYALEHRDDRVRLASGSELAVPRNVVVIATVNTTERALVSIPGAVRRPFASILLPPRYDVLARFLQGRGFEPSGLVQVLAAAARALASPELAPGTAGFFRDDLPAHIEDVWETELLQHLAQHLDPERLKPFRWERVRDTVLGR